MATLKDLHDLLLKSGISDTTATMILAEVRTSFGGDKIYIPPPGSRKNPERSEAICKAASRLPTGVVAARFGVSRQYIAKIIKK